MQPPEGTPVKEESVIVAVERDTVTITILDTLNDGKVVTSKFSAPAAGGPVTDIDQPAEPGSASVMKKIDNHTYLNTSTMNGKVVLEQLSVVSPDNKTLTVEESGVDPSGKPFKARLVYDRQ